MEQQTPAPQVEAGTKGHDQMTSPMSYVDQLSGGMPMKGVEQGENTFYASSNFGALRVVTRNPVLLQPGNTKSRELDPDIEHEQDIHELVQRVLTGKKRSNAESYADYIEKMVNGEVGVLPPIHLWCRFPLKRVTLEGESLLMVPHGEKLIAIDGETQLTAHWKLDARLSPEARQLHRELPLGAVIHHGIDTQTARQYFHDLNVLAVRPNTSLSLGMDTQDPITRTVDAVEFSVPALTGRVEKQARQLAKASSKIVTLQNLRQMVINTAKGISGIQYGARPVPVDDIDLDALSKVATNWIATFFDSFAKEIADREHYLASSGAVLASVGAIGQQLFRADPGERAALADQFLAALKDVDWAKGDHWSGIAGNYTDRGAFSVKGTKEVAYAVHTALTDSNSSSYRRVRHLSEPENADSQRWN